MNRKSKATLKRVRRGLTLIEAVLGTAILGTLLVAILMGASRLQAQAVRAEQRATACQIADALLEAWWAKPEEFPRSAGGTAKPYDGWSWRTCVVENAQAQGMKTEVVALEVFGPGTKQGEAAVRVEVLLPEKPREDGADAR